MACLRYLSIALIKKGTVPSHIRGGAPRQPGYTQPILFSSIQYDTQRKEHIGDGGHVPIDQVIMYNESDVVLHSLKGDKWLNGKVGVIQDWNVEAGRYAVRVVGRKELATVKPQNVLPAYMGCDKKEVIEFARRLSK